MPRPPQRMHSHDNALQHLEANQIGWPLPSNESRAPKIDSELDAGDAQQQMAAARQASATFGEIVTLLMRHRPIRAFL